MSTCITKLETPLGWVLVVFKVNSLIINMQVSLKTFNECVKQVGR